MAGEVYTSGVLNSLTLEELAQWTELSGGNVSGWMDTINAGGYAVTEREAIESLASGYLNYYKNAEGTYTITSFIDTAQSTATNAVNSNLNTISRGAAQIPVDVSATAGGAVEMSTTPAAAGGLSSNATYFLANVGQAITAAQVGIALGKAIDSTLYNANPSFWDGLGLSSLDPATWGSITNGDDSIGATLFNLILGIDPYDNTTTAFIPEDTLAYMAWALKESGIFNSGQPEPFVPTSNTINITSTMSAADTVAYAESLTPRGIDWGSSYVSRETVIRNLADAMAHFGSACVVSLDTVQLTSGSFAGSGWVFNATPYTVGSTFTAIHHSVSGQEYWDKSATGYNVYVKMAGSSGTERFKVTGCTLATYTATTTLYYPYYRNSTNLLTTNSNVHTAPIYSGITNQPNATLPDITTWTDPQSTLTSLRQQYPSLFTNPLIWNNVQPDGTNPQITYVPVPMPSVQTITDPETGVQTQVLTQPITDINDSSQTSPKVDIQPDTTGSNQNIIDLISSLIQQNPDPEIDPETESETLPQPYEPIQNPIDTGTGDTPSIPTPTGSASALWSVYHPTQTQVNDFGAWLWSGNIITQIQQLLQNPMEGIITLHKIFATPVDSGTGTIVVGRLDSNVSSALVSQQYVNVDCGSVSLDEQFGSVFDYSPYTAISLYLPFIGIVPLNVEDVMRSVIHVEYGVDVFTGACLAMVEVIRDSHTAIMYQYTGVASVEYPLTGSVHSGLINGLLGIAGGVVGVASAATGVGAVTGAAAIAGGVANFNRANNAKSGSFSGNSGAMGVKTPYLIIERPQTKVATTFPAVDGYPTNYSVKLGNCSNHVVCKTVHVSGISATIQELEMIESLLKSGIEI